MQVVVLVPIVLFLVLLSVQAAIYFHAANVATAGAARGAAAGSAREATAQSAAQAAASTVSEMGSALAGSPAVELSPTSVRVSVTIAVPRIVPFFPSMVRRHADEPRESFVPEDQR